MYLFYIIICVHHKASRDDPSLSMQTLNMINLKNTNANPEAIIVCTQEVESFVPLKLSSKKQVLQVGEGRNPRS